MPTPEFEPIERKSSPELDEILGKPFPVLDHGFVRVVDYMGDESSIVQAARVSYGPGTKTKREDRGLLRYLLRKRHTSPFELAVLKLHVKLPIFVERQWVRHRTASLNEMSARYSVLPTEYYVPEQERLQRQSKSNKQGSADSTIGLADVVQDQLRIEAQRQFESYEEYLETGLAREVARINLPLSAYTEKYWQMDLHNLLGFLQLRMDAHAQWEIREYAHVIGEFVARWMPIVWEAFEEFRLGGVTFSAVEHGILAAMTRGDLHEVIEIATAAGWLDRHEDDRLKRRSERIEFEQKLDAIGTKAPWL